MSLLICKPNSTDHATDVLIIKAEPDGIFLLRYKADGTFRGDTWHISNEDAFEQAASEYPQGNLQWVEVDSDELPESLARRVGRA